MNTTALFAGSFDPIHDGHVHVIEKALDDGIDRVLVAVCGNPAKRDRYSLSLEQAGALANRNLRHLDPSRVTVITSTHSVSTIALDFGCDYILRGYRTQQEKEKEEQEFRTLASLNLFPRWTRLKLVHGNINVSSTEIKGMIREFLSPEDISIETESLMNYMLNNAMSVRLVDDHDLVASLFRPEHGTLFDCHSYLQTLKKNPTPGFTKMLTYVEYSPTKNLIPYYLQQFRKQCKTWQPQFRLIQTNFIKVDDPCISVASAPAFSLVVNDQQKAGKLQKRVVQYGFGVVYHLELSGNEQEQAKQFNGAVKEIRSQITEGMQYERNWRVPDHQTALGRELR